MSTSSTGDFNLSLTNGSIEDKVTALVEIVERQQETVKQQQDTIDEQQDTIDELTETVGDLRDDVDELRDAVDEQPEVDVEDDGDPLGSVTVDGAPLGRALKSKPSRTDVEDMIENTTPTPQTEIDGSTDPQTPIERLSRSDDVSDVTDSISVERAVSLFEHLTDWGRKTPKGYTLRPKDRPKELLESARDESLNWKQYYRACRALERLSEGAVTFVKTERHGNTVVFHERSDVFTRQTERLSATTAGATT